MDLPHTQLKQRQKSCCFFLDPRPRIPGPENCHNFGGDPFLGRGVDPIYNPFGGVISHYLAPNGRGPILTSNLGDQMEDARFLGWHCFLYSKFMHQLSIVLFNSLAILYGLYCCKKLNDRSRWLHSFLIRPPELGKNFSDSKYDLGISTTTNNHSEKTSWTRMQQSFAASSRPNPIFLFRRPWQILFNWLFGLLGGSSKLVYKWLGSPPLIYHLRDLEGVPQPYLGTYKQVPSTTC